MSAESTDLSEWEQRLSGVLVACLESAEGGRVLDQREMLARHPEFAAELREFFANRDQLDQLAVPLRLMAQASCVNTPAPTEPGCNALTSEVALSRSDLKGRLFGDYELLEEIGRGGMGVVYQAFQKSLNRLVALKMVRFAELPSQVDLQRFRNEAEATARLDHPNIVPIYEVGEQDGQPYFSMKLIEGGSLSRHLDWFTKDQRAAAQLLLAVARAVHYAHQHGILHRDLKPGNVLLDDQGRPYVTDFGLAKRIEGGCGVSQSGTATGTPSYMAPEQAAGNRVLSTAIDVYGLGAILYELLTERPPFRGNTPLNTLLEVMEREPQQPGKVKPGVDRDLETICLKCLKKDPQRRYGSAEALAADLERWLDGEPIWARQSGAWERLWKWAKRRPALAALVAVSGVAALAIVGVVVGLVYNARLQEAFHEADDLRRAEEGERKKAESALGQAENYLYFYRINLAQRERAANNVDRATQVLDECPSSLRGWEWHYLKRLCDNGSLAGLPQANLTGALRGKHHRAVYSVAFSPNSQRLASASADHTVKVWDVTTGFELLTLYGHSDYVESVAFSPDGTRLASAGADKAVKVWDAMTGKETFSLRGHVEGVNSVAFSPDGKRLASGSDDRTVKVWDAAGTELLTLRGHTDAVLSLAFHPGGRQLASASADQTIRVWDVVTGQNLLTLRGHTERVRSVAFSPDGRRLASASQDRTVRVWDAETGQEVLSLDRHSGAVWGVAFSRDSRRLASAAKDRTVTIWDPEARKEILILAAHAHAVVFSPDGHRLAWAGGDGTVGVWDATPRE